MHQTSITYLVERLAILRIASEHHVKAIQRHVDGMKEAQSEMDETNAAISELERSLEVLQAANRGIQK